MTDQESVYVLGIDGGGTKTSVLILDQRGQVCGSGLSGPSNYDDVGVDGSRTAIARAVSQARLQAAENETGLPEGKFSAVFLGMGGAASETDRKNYQRIALDLGLAEPQYIGVDHDIRIALAGGLSGRAGVVLIAGTGSSCYGRNPLGEHWQSGGWGHLIADEGSGYWLGIQAMRAAMMAYDGRIPSTLLMEAVRNKLGLQSLPEIMHHLYVEGATRAEIAALAPLVMELARAGDPAAQTIIREGVSEMARCVQAAAEKLGFDTCSLEVALSGGLTRAGAVYLEPLEKAISDRLPGCRVLLAEQPPVVGACLLALEMLGLNNDVDH